MPAGGGRAAGGRDLQVRGPVHRPLDILDQPDDLLRAFPHLLQIVIVEMNRTVRLRVIAGTHSGNGIGSNPYRLAVRPGQLDEYITPHEAQVAAGVD